MADSALKKSRSEANGDLSSMPIHMADIGSDNFEQEFTLSLMENDGGTLAQIEASLERIEEGTYGQCEECGVKIPKSRLNAIPYATLCVRAPNSRNNGLETSGPAQPLSRVFRPGDGRLCGRSGQQAVDVRPPRHARTPAGRGGSGRACSAFRPA